MTRLGLYIEDPYSEATAIALSIGAELSSIGVEVEAFLPNCSLAQLGDTEWLNIANHNIYAYWLSQHRYVLYATLPNREHQAESAREDWLVCPSPAKLIQTSKQLKKIGVILCPSQHSARIGKNLGLDNIEDIKWQPRWEVSNRAGGPELSVLLPFWWATSESCDNTIFDVLVELLAATPSKATLGVDVSNFDKHARKAISKLQASGKLKVQKVKTLEDKLFLFQASDLFIWPTQSAGLAGTLQLAAATATPGVVFDGILEEGTTQNNLLHKASSAGLIPYGLAGRQVIPDYSAFYEETLQLMRQPAQVYNEQLTAQETAETGRQTFLAAIDTLTQRIKL